MKCKLCNHEMTFKTVKVSMSYDSREETNEYQCPNCGNCEVTETIKLYKQRNYPSLVSDQNRWRKEFEAQGRGTKLTYINIWDAFIYGAREAQTNPCATEKDFQRAADAYCKMII